ncbi:MAG TPA: hypothetical protein ENG87_05140 [Candidatus Pacearchaeota archaeon]|nr:hypothetical protein BMS3Abin17_00921 [archaeon BMS3Abin17]HDK42742.1 hypothetical protein [Candidatus Pacearchaeota archaeon]HDZ61404.1 hypothetical protein [Candidatus Pacearchaeota archaeon]
MPKPIKKNKGVSPVIATVLLIAMVVVIALIIFLWFRSMLEDKITKFGDTNIKLICEEVSFDASYSSGILSIVNTGNIPIYKIKIKIISVGSHETKDLSEISDWPNTGINQGGTFSGSISGEIGSANKLIVIPVLIGESDKGQKSYVCNERHGYDILI